MIKQIIFFSPKQVLARIKVNRYLLYILKDSCSTRLCEEIGLIIRNDDSCDSPLPIYCTWGTVFLPGRTALKEQSCEIWFPNFSEFIMNLNTVNSQSPDWFDDEKKGGGRITNFFNNSFSKPFLSQAFLLGLVWKKAQYVDNMMIK